MEYFNMSSTDQKRRYSAFKRHDLLEQIRGTASPAEARGTMRRAPDSKPAKDPQRQLLLDQIRSPPSGNMAHQRMAIEESVDLEESDGPSSAPLSAPPVTDPMLLNILDSGDIDRLRRFLKLKGAYTAVVGKKTIADLAAERGNADVLEMLHGLQFDFNKRNGEEMVPFHYAIKKQQLATLRQLTVYGANPDLQLPTVSGKVFSDTPLHVACAISDKNLLETLLKECGAKLDVMDAQGNSPLHRACLEDSLLAVRTLVPYLTEPVVNMQGHEGKTALHIAVLNQNREMVRLLLMVKGALVDVPAGNAKTVIDIVLELNNHMILNDFVHYYTNIKLKDLNAGNFRELIHDPQFELYLKFLSNVDNEFDECTMSLKYISECERTALCAKLQHDDNIDLIEFKEVILLLLQTKDIHELIKQKDDTILIKVVENIVHYVLFKEDAEMLENIMCCGILWSQVAVLIEDHLDTLYLQTPEREVNGIMKHFRANFIEDEVVQHDKLAKYYGEELSCYKLQPFDLEANPVIQYMRHPMNTLPVWSVLSGRLSLTELLLRQEKFDVVPLALFCAGLLRSFHQNSEVVVEREEIEDLALTCEKFARKVVEKVNSVDTSHNHSVSVDYLLRPLESYGGVSCVKLAASNHCADFLQSELCQCALDKMWFRSLLPLTVPQREVVIWMGAIPMNLLCPLLLRYFEKKEDDARRSHEERPFITDDQSKQRSAKFQLFHRRKKSLHHKGDNVGDAMGNYDLPVNNGDFRLEIVRQRSSVNFNGDGANPDPLILPTKCSKDGQSLESVNQVRLKCRLATLLYAFYTTPAVKFRFHIAAHLLLVLMMSYFLLIHFTYDICFAEFISYAILSGLLMEEIGEVLQYVEHNDIRSYIRSKWNLIDLSALSCGGIGFVIRMSQISPASDQLDMQRDFSDDSWYCARVYLSICCTLYWIRLLYVSTVLENLGPKLKMIAEMIIKDLLPFLLILFTFILGFGVLMHSLLYPNGYRAWNSARINNTDVLLGMLRICFYSMVGDYGLDTILGGDSCDSIYLNSTDNTGNCPHKFGRYLVPYLILPLYVIVTEILLLNLIVAMFSKTIDAIDAQSKDLWQFERYKLIEEFETRSGLPPPLNIIDLLRKLGVLVRKYCCLCWHRICGRVDQARDDGSFNQRLVLQFLLFQAFSLRNSRESLMRQCVSKQETDTEKMLMKVRDIVEAEVSKAMEHQGPDVTDAPTYSGGRLPTVNASSRLIQGTSKRLSAPRSPRLDLNRKVQQIRRLQTITGAMAHRT